jgi:hypothetical protein
MVLDLRPLSIGELLDRSFTLYREHFTTFVGIMAAPSVVALLMALTVSVAQFLPLLQAVRPTPEQVLLASVVMVSGVVVLGSAYWLVYLVALGATTTAVSELYLGRTPTIARGYRSVRGHLGRLFLLTLLISLRLIGVMVVCLGVPGVMAGLLARNVPIVVGVFIMIGALAGMCVVLFFGLRYAVSIPALMLEPLGANAAIGRSVFLTQGLRWRVFLLLLCAMVVSYASMMILQLPFMVAAALVGPQSMTGFWLNIVGTFTGTIGNAVTAPVMIIGFAVLYFDARIRKEGLDLQIMAAALDRDGAPLATASIPATASPR